jgi:predicted DNA-binding transcriptional regulator AlpA
VNRSRQSDETGWPRPVSRHRDDVKAKPVAKERPVEKVGGAGRGPPGLMSLIDKEQLAHKLEMRVGEVVTHAQQRGFPSPIAYFRGRILWDETAIHRWLGERTNQ